MELKPAYKPGQATLDTEELAGLKLNGIKSLDELEAIEAKGIAKTRTWSEKHVFGPEKIFTEAFIREIHKRMFADVWEWAGKYRLTNRKLGVDKALIRSELKQLFNNITFWIETETYEPDEVAVRFMHRLTQIQCFPDGNGRHARLMADIVVEHLLNSEPFSWGNSVHDADARQKLIDALQKADKGKMDDLLKFARS